MAEASRLGRIPVSAAGSLLRSAQWAFGLSCLLPAILLFTILRNVCDPDPRRAGVRPSDDHGEKEGKVRSRSPGPPVEDRPIAVPARDVSDGSKVAHHLKELRPGSRGRSEIRIIFAFDPARSALLLLGGDKAGNWERWYRDNIPQAEQLYFEYTTDDKE